MTKNLKLLVIVVMICCIGLPATIAGQLERESLDVLFNKGNEIPLTDIKNLGTKEASRIWGDVTAGPAIPLCDVRGNILAYQLVFHLGQDNFPSDEAIFQEVRLNREAWAQNQTGNSPGKLTEKAPNIRESFGTLVVGARYDVDPLLAFNKGLPPYFTNLEEARKLATKILTCKAPQLNRIYAAGHPFKWFEFKSAEKTTLINIYTLKVREPGVITYLAEKENTQRWKEAEAILRPVWKNRIASVKGEAERFYVAGTTTRYISGVPFYYWRKGCSPTASAMVLGYWENHGYSRLIDTNYYDMIDDLAVYMGTDSGGGTDRDDIAPGIKYLTNNVRSYKFNTTGSNTGYYTTVGTSGSHWSDITGEINAGRPMVWSVFDYTNPTDGRVVNHSVTVVGYKKNTTSHWYWLFTKWDCYALVHTTWDHPSNPHEYYWKVMMRSGITGQFYYSEAYSDHVVKIYPGKQPAPGKPSVNYSYIPAGDLLMSSPIQTTTIPVEISYPSEQSYDASYPKMTWNAVSGAVKYEIYRQTKTNGTVSGWSLISTRTSTSYTDYGKVVRDAVYTSPPSTYGDYVAYKVRALNIDNVAGSYSSIGYYRPGSIPSSGGGGGSDPPDRVAY